MKLVTKFDDAIIDNCVQRRSEALFMIYWTDESEFYPSPSWIDFGGVILGWWMVQFNRLKSNGSCELRFMDGPFSIKLIADSDTVRAVSEEVNWTTSKANIRWQIQNAGQSAIEYFESRHVFSESCDSLRKGIAMIC